MPPRAAAPEAPRGLYAAAESGEADARCTRGPQGELPAAAAAREEQNGLVPRQNKIGPRQCAPRRALTGAGRRPPRGAVSPVADPAALGARDGDPGQGLVAGCVEIKIYGAPVLNRRVTAPSTRRLLDGGGVGLPTADGARARDTYWFISRGRRVPRINGRGGHG